MRTSVLELDQFTATRALLPPLLLSELSYLFQSGVWNTSARVRVLLALGADHLPAERASSGGVVDRDVLCADEGRAALAGSACAVHRAGGFELLLLLVERCCQLAIDLLLDLIPIEKDAAAHGNAKASILQTFADHRLEALGAIIMIARRQPEILRRQIFKAAVASVRALADRSKVHCEVDEAVELVWCLGVCLVD